MNKGKHMHLRYIKTVVVILDEIALTYVVKTKDSFYAGQALNISCYFPNLPDEDGLLILSLSFGNHGFLCKREAGGGGWEHTRLGGDLPSDMLYNLTNDDCNLPAAGNTMTVWFTITDALLNLEFVCTNLNTQNKSSASLQINKILGKSIKKSYEIKLTSKINKFACLSYLQYWLCFPADHNQSQI